MADNVIVVNYQDHLKGIIARYGNRSPERTRAQLKLAATELLETTNYGKIRINNICKQAKLAQGSFYNHFKKQEDLIVEVLTDYSKIQQQIMPDVSDMDDPYNALLTYNTWYARSVSANARIQATLMQLSETLPAAKEIWSDYSIKVTAPVTKLINRVAKKPVPEDFNTLIVYSVAGMLDQALYVIYGTNRNLEYQRASINIDHLVETITGLQYRTIFLANPPKDRLKSATALLDIVP